MSDLTVGVVLKPQGIRGEIKIKPFTDGAETFAAFKRVFLDGAEYRVLSFRSADGFVYLGLRGKQVTIPREEAPALPEGSYYIADLLGSEIVTEEGVLLGTLKDITQAATDIYVLDTGKKEILFPAASGVVVNVDAAAGRITVNKRRFEEVAVL